MATDRKVGSAFVEIMSRGLGTVQKDLNRVKGELVGTEAAGKRANVAARELGEAAQKAASPLEGLSAAFRRIGQFATRAFIAGKIAILGMVGVADPVRFQEFGVSLQILALQIGRIFIPLLQAAREGVDRLAAYFRGLTDEQRLSILEWTKVVFVGLAFAAVLPRLIRLVAAVSVVVRSFTVGLNLLLASNPVGWALAAVGALVALVTAFNAVQEGTQETGSVLGGLKAVWESLKGTFFKVVEALQPVFAVLTQAFVSLLEGAKPIIDGLGVIFRGLVDYLGGVFDRLKPIFSAAVDAMRSIFATLGDVIGSVVEAVKPLLFGLANVVLTVFNTVVNVVQALTPVFRGVFAAVAGIVGVFAKIFQTVFEALTPVLDVVVSALEVFAEIVGDIFGNVAGDIGNLFEKISPFLQSAIALMIESINSLKPVFETVFSFIGQVLKQTISGFIFLATVIKKALKFEFSDAFQAGVDAVKDFESRIADKKKQREEKGEKTDEPTAPEKPGPTRTGGGKTPDFQPKLRQEAPQLIGLIEAYKRVQTSAQEDPQKRLEEERLRESRKQTDYLEDIRDNTKRIEPGGMGD